MSEPATRRRYFAYGANMIAEDMARRCPHAREIGSVTLPGWRLVVGRKGYATLIRDPGARVMGVLWSLTPQCEQTLDEFEEIDNGLFQRNTIDVEGEPALVYVAVDDTPGLPRAHYLEAVIAAAEARGFPADYLEELRGWLSRA
ncbi:MAG: gamma-glutamylcyclotransferase family protein [Stellaceae bacterium]